MKTNLKKNIIGFVSLLFILIMFSNHALANNEFDENRDTSFTIELKHEGIVLPGVEFDVYKVANLDKEGKITLLKEFEKYPIEFEDLDPSGWNDYALTLKSYIVRDKVEAVLKGKTNQDGIFNASLKPGLYLIIGNQAKIGSYTYKTSPYFVLLPAFDKETGEWQYDFTSYPKTLKEDKDRTSKKIIKIWNDSGYEDQRPESIEVEVFADNESYELVSLSKSNNWQHTLVDLDPNLDWSVVEKDIEGGNYKVLVEEEGDTFTVENTHIGKKPDGKPDEKPDGKPQKKPSLRPKELPNTGQLWWPIYVLVGGGIIFIMLGFILNKRKGSK